MSGAPIYRQVFSPQKHTKSVAKHAARLPFAIIILGLNAHIVRFCADNVLMYSIVITIITILTRTYSIVRLYVSTTTKNVEVSLGIHLFMSLFWLVDIGFILMLVSQWRELDSVAHFKMLVARVTIGAFEFLLWFIPMAELILAVVDKREHMSSDEHIPMPQMHATATGPIPITPTQRVEQWDSSTDESHRKGPQPLLPES
ncbi:hypothetical protein G6011_05611 [Alternaria panax]|uniref:Uncharacterized protein n=1 Tax=Alternaria panax TaxID=48097 RepID=A0AAD4I3S5_9PLEO|nr:hypothetical protein G6011_05611 [Alternaria panax]